MRLGRLLGVVPFDGEGGAVGVAAVWGGWASCVVGRRARRDVGGWWALYQLG